MRRAGRVFIAIGGRIWALWGLILFVSTMVIAMVFYAFCYLMKEPQRANWHRQVSRVWMGFFLSCIGCPLKIRGKEHFEKGKNYIIVCNHNSFMDVPVTTPFMPRANKTIGKKDFAWIPFFGWIYSLGSVLVDRKDERSRKQSYNRMKHVLSIGLDMVVYPEGTRNKTAEPLKPFYDGAFRLAVDTGVAVVPALLFNTRKVLPAARPFFLLPHKLEMHFLASLPPGDLTVAALKQQVFDKMKTYYVANGGNSQ